MKGLLDGLQWREIADQQAVQTAIAARIAEGFKAPDWADAWSVKLDHLSRTGCRLEDLTPRFVGTNRIYRWQGRYIEAVTPDFEQRVIERVRDWLFKTYLADVSHLYEFGAGSCCNVAAYAKMFPETPITALDSAPASVCIAELLRQHHGMDVEGQRFDFCQPDPAMALAPGSGVLTWCALEQVGDEHGAFIDFLVRSRPRRVAHVEPVAELYDPADLFDKLALDYHHKRRYLRRLLPSLQDLEKDEEIHIVHQERLGFGSRFHDAYSVIVWEPQP